MRRGAASGAAAAAGGEGLPDLRGEKMGKTAFHTPIKDSGFKLPEDMFLFLKRKK